LATKLVGELGRAAGGRRDRPPENITHPRVFEHLEGCGRGSTPGGHLFAKHGRRVAAPGRHAAGPQRGLDGQLPGNRPRQSERDARVLDRLDQQEK
jgi:hypothetical protein